MSYIGNTATTQAFTPAIDYFSGTGSATAFTLSKPVASVAQVQVVVNNVAQNPSSAYTVSSNTITFTSAPSAGTNNIYVYYTSPITQLIAPSQGTVTTSSLNSTFLLPVVSGGTGVSTSTGSGSVVLGTSPTLTTPIVTTTMGVGNATPATTGAGITFPATQSASSEANTLDDYEEGTWSPSYSSSSGSGLVITTNSATYTKIGRAVTLSLDFTVTTVASSGGVIYINNLPFAGTTGNGSMCFREIAIAGWSGAAQLSTTTQLQFSKYDGTTPIVASARPAGFLTYFTST